jgi:phytoene/squalene synthetase
MMKDSSAALARSITWKGSKQTYFTIRLLVDRDLRDDGYRAYAYFRWSDDVVDDPAFPQDKRITFIKRQRELIDRLYKGEKLADLSPEEKMLADLIAHDRGGLESYIRNFFKIIEFDALRKGKPINDQGLDIYIDTLAKGVTDGIQYFVGNRYTYPKTNDRYMAATAAHITHLLRDMKKDLANGFINGPKDCNREWVKGRVELARRYFREGKKYISKLKVWRARIAAYAYCFRFERILRMIERDNYELRYDY